MFRNGRKVSRKELEEKRKKKREEKKKQRRKNKRLKKRRKKKIESKSKNKKGSPKQKSRTGGRPSGTGGNNNPLGDNTNRSPLGDEGVRNPLDDGLGGNPLDDNLGGVPYPDLNDNEQGVNEEEEKEGITKKTFRMAKNAARRAKRAWKWFRRLRNTGAVMSFLTTFAVPILVSVLLFIFVVIPFTVVLLPTGTFVALDDGGKEETEEVVEEDKGKEEKKSKGSGGGKINAKSDKEFMKGSTWPSDKANYVTSLPGGRKSPGGIGSTDHKGIDIAIAGNAEGLNILAYQDGEVVETAEGCVVGDIPCGGYLGNNVKIQHNDKYKTVYAHMKEVKVKEGDKVSSGDVIGIIGDTGQSDGAHLHFEVHVDGDFHNPAPYLKKFGNEGLQLK